MSFESIVSRVVHRSSDKYEFLEGNPELTFKVGTDWIPDLEYPMDDQDLADLIQDMIYEDCKAMGGDISKSEVDVDKVGFGGGDKTWKSTTFTAIVTVGPFEGKVYGKGTGLVEEYDAWIRPESFSIMFGGRGEKESSNKEGSKESSNKEGWLKKFIVLLKNINLGDYRTMTDEDWDWIIDAYRPEADHFEYFLRLNENRTFDKENDLNSLVIEANNILSELEAQLLKMQRDVDTPELNQTLDLIHELQKTKTSALEGLKVTDYGFFEAPPDDLDPDFAMTAEVTFSVSGPLLAKLLGRQQRMVERVLKELKPDKAIRQLHDGPASDTILKALKRYVDRSVYDMGQEEYDRDAYMERYDWGNTEYWEARIGPNSITYRVELDVLGEWD